MVGESGGFFQKIFFYSVSIIPLRGTRVDTLQVEISLRELSLDNKGSRTPKGYSFARRSHRRNPPFSLLCFCKASLQTAIPPLPKSTAFGVPLHKPLIGTTRTCDSRCKRALRAKLHVPLVLARRPVLALFAVHAREKRII